MASPKRVYRAAAMLVGVAAMFIADVASAQSLRLIRDTEIEETIRAESAAGRGTTITISLPRQAEG